MPEPHAPDFAESRAIVADALDVFWPKFEAGKILSWNVSLASDGSVVVHVDHFGAAVGAGGLAILGQTLGDRLHARVSVDERALSGDTIAITPATLPTAWASFQALVDGARAVGAVHLCMTRPLGPPVLDGLAPMMTSSLASLPPGRASIAPGRAWTARLSMDACEPADAGPNDASAGDAETDSTPGADL